MHTRYVDQTGKVDLDHYNTYDAANRQLIVNGKRNSDGTTVYGDGHLLTYDGAGQRTSDTYLYTNGGVVFEEYRFDNAGRLTHTMRGHIAIDQRWYDEAGRVVRTGVESFTPGRFTENNVSDNDRDFLGQIGVSTSYTTYAYDKSGKVTRQKNRDMKVTSNADDQREDLYFGVLNDGRPGHDGLVGYDAAGNLRGYYLVPTQASHDRQVVYHYDYHYTDGAQVGAEKVITGLNLNNSRTTERVFDVNGHLVETKGDGPARTFVNDAQGRILMADSGFERTFSLVVNGELMGTTNSRFNQGKPSNFATTYTGMKELSQTGTSVYESPRVL